MPRIRQKAAVYAAEDFWKEVRIRMICMGINSDRQLAGEMGVAPSTLCKRKQHTEDLALCELQEIVRVLRPDPKLVLKLLGYNGKDLRKCFETSTNICPE